MTPAPFVVFSLPRSRSYWLAKFLTFGPWICGHEEIRHARGIDDVQSWLSQPFVGTCETAAASYWRLLRSLAPGARVVVVRRPVADVVASAGALGLGVDLGLLGAVMHRADAKLQQLVARWPGALEVAFSDLEEEATCARVFEHCTGLRHDRSWWRVMASANLQRPAPEMTRYFAAFRPQVAKAAAAAKGYILAEIRSGKSRGL